MRLCATCLSLLLLATLPAQAQTYCVPDGMRAYFSFERTLASRAGVQGPQDGPLNPEDRPALTHAAARIGHYAAAFDGLDDHLDYTSPLLDTGFGRMSILFWMRPDATDGIQTLFDEGGATTGVAVRLNGTTLEAAVREEGTQVTLTHPTPVAAGEWQHVALVYDRGDVTLYLNGVPDDDPDGATGFGPLADHDDPGGFGATLAGDAFGTAGAPGTVTHPFGGLLDDLAYYRSSGQQGALTEAQIAATVACDPLLAFACDASVYVAQNAPTELKRIDTATSPFSFATVDDPGALAYNAVGLNPLDGFAYGFAFTSTDNSLLRVAADGTLTDLGPFPEIAGEAIYSGDVSPDGRYYLLSVDAAPTVLSVVDLTTVPYAVSTVTLDQPVTASDLAYNPVDGLLYGVATGDPADLFTIDPATGAVTRTPLALAGGDPLPSASGYGAAWFNALGQFFAYYNPGEVYRIDLDGATPVASFVSPGPASGFNDGFSCAVAPVQADVGVDKEVVSEPVPPIAAGAPFTYTIAIENAGPAIASNLVVEDILPEGLRFVSAQVDSLESGAALPADRYALSTPDPGAPGTVALTLFDLALGPANAVRLTIHAEAAVTLEESPINTVAVMGLDQEDPNAENDQDSAGGGLTSVEDGTTPAAFYLEAPHPNPFGPAVTLRYGLPEPAAVRLEVYDVLGRRVALLVDEVQAAGRYEVVLDGRGLASGTYVGLLQAGTFRTSRLLVRVE